MRMGLRKRRMSDWFARSMTQFFKFFADVFFAGRYGNRAVVLETIAAVPGMVAGMWIHLKSLRKLQKGDGTKLHELLAEAENERKHLLFFMEIAHPNWLERFIVVVAQFIFWHYYLLVYIVSPKTAHKMVYYFEEEAVRSYTSYLKQIAEGKIENVPAPQIAIDYYGLTSDARLSDMVRRVRDDEQKHADANLNWADTH